MAIPIHITDFQAPELDIYARWTENQLVNREDPENAMFIAESPLVIERALAGGCVPISFLMEEVHWNAAFDDLLTKLPADIPVYLAQREVLVQLTGFHLTRGMLCAMARPKRASVDALCKNAKRVAVLVDVMNPTNVGAIFRSAAALGMDAVLLTSACSDPFYRRASRVSMGTVFQVPWTYFEKGSDWQGTLQTLGFQTAAMALKENTLHIADPKLREIEKLAILLGTEGAGLPDEIIERCDYSVKIPMTHGVDSLNVAAASAVVFYQLGLMHTS